MTVALAFDIYGTLLDGNRRPDRRERRSGSE